MTEIERIEQAIRLLTRAALTFRGTVFEQGLLAKSLEVQIQLAKQELEIAKMVLNAD